MIDRAEALDRYDLSIYAEPYANWRGKALDALAKRAPAGACIGAFDTLNAPPHNSPSQAVANGWAWELSRDRPPRRIVMTNTTGVVVGFGSAGIVRPDVKAARAEVDADDSGWTGFAILDGRPVEAFALMSDGAACALGTLPGPLRK